MSVFTPTTVFLTPAGKLVVALIGDALELYEGLRKGYQKIRPVTTDPSRKRTYPETTYGDIIAIVDVWERAFSRDYRADEDVWGMREQWQGYLGRLAKAFEGADPAARFPGNREFWLNQTSKLATRLSVVRVVPTRTSIAIESFKDGVESYYGGMLRMALNPREAIVGITRAGAELLVDVADASTKPWRNLLGGWKVPLLIGAGVIAAIVIVPPLLRRAPTPVPRSA